MNWIKTHRGSLCNLGRAVAVELKRPIGDEIRFEIVARFDSGESIVIAWFGIEADANQYMRGIGQRLSTASCELNRGERP